MLSRASLRDQHVTDPGVMSRAQYVTDLGITHHITPLPYFRVFFFFQVHPYNLLPRGFVFFSWPVILADKAVLILKCVQRQCILKIVGQILSQFYKTFLFNQAHAAPAFTPFNLFYI